MDEYLKTFKTSIQIKPELIEKYESQARYEGDKIIKADLANAKRTATMLTKAAASFRFLTDKDKLALDNAATAMLILAQDLANAATWAKKYHAHCQVVRENWRIAELKTLANSRWGQDDDAYQFERDLIAELETKDGKAAMLEWMHGNDAHKDVAVQNFHGPSDLGQRPDLRKSDPARLQLATVVQHILNNRDGHKFAGMSGTVYTYSSRDYEAYFTWRHGVAKHAAKALQGLRHAPQ